MTLFSRTPSTPKKGRKLPPDITPSLDDIAAEASTTPRGRQTERGRQQPLPSLGIDTAEFGVYNGQPSKSRYIPPFCSTKTKSNSDQKVRILSTNLQRPLTPPLSPQDEDPPLLPSKYSFLPTSIPPSSSSNSIDSFAYSTDEGTTLRHYGFLGGVGAGVVLGVEDVAVVLRDVGDELQRRGELVFDRRD